MNTLLWIVQIILGIKLLSVSYSHGLRQSQPIMQDAIRRLGSFAQPLHYGIAFAAFVGALGLTLPGALGLPAQVLPVTAILLAGMLLSSIFFHIRSREQPKVFVSLILFAFAALVAYGRWPFTP
jgi:hypothetical protein